jgi:hypothetical protein
VVRNRLLRISDDKKIIVINLENLPDGVTILSVLSKIQGVMPNNAPRFWKNGIPTPPPLDVVSQPEE